MSERAGLYLHVPFCSAICPYCDFAVSRGDARARDRFTAALVGEIRSAGAAEPGLGGARSSLGGASFDTVYLGGGTPSFLEPGQLEAILAAARGSLDLDPEAFVVLEANPEDVTVETVAAWRALGVSGVSLGIQSFDRRVLRFLGRRHKGEEARRAAELALGAGFEWLSIDLLYGSPGASWDPLAVALDDVAAAVALGPQHVSCYQLTVHEGTPFARARDRGLLRELDSDAEAALFLAVHGALAAAGFPAYEVSNFASARAHRSRHNAKYWRHVPYLGLGPSAHSFDGRSRWWNLRDWRDWAAAVESGAGAVGGREALGAQELALERLMLGLRTADGVELDAYRERYGFDLLAANAERVERAVAAGLLVLEGSTLRPTTSGLAVADALAASFEVGAGDREAQSREAERREAPGSSPAPLVGPIVE